MTDLNSLTIFAKVVEANSFSEAARRLSMPTSTVSRRVADLEGQLGVRLLERSTRSLRLTDVGSKVLEHARRSAELSEAVDNIVSNLLSNVSGVLRLSAPPSISDSLVVPLVGAFQASYANVRVQIFVTERFVDHIAEGVDGVQARRAQGFDADRAEDPDLPASTRSERCLSREVEAAQDRTYSATGCSHSRIWNPENSWSFAHVNGRNKETLTFEPYLSMNDYDGLAHALLAGVGIGELPPLVQPELVRDGRLVEVIPKWRFRTFNLSVVHLGNRYTRGRCARSRNSRHKWRQSSFQSFLIEKNLY